MFFAPLGKLVPVIDLYISFLRTVILYGVIVLTLRILGKRQIGELEPTELVVAILISDLAAVPMQDVGIPLLSGVIPIVTLLALELLVSELSLRSVRLRTFFSGKPELLIHDGVLDQGAMRRARLTVDELMECLRQQGTANLPEIQFAILETNGQLSVFPYPQFAPMTPERAGQEAPPMELPVTIISDGRVLTENLTGIGKDEAWLSALLSDAAVAQSEVFLLTATPTGNTHLVKKEAQA